MEFYEFKEGCIVATGKVDEDGIMDYEEYEINSITAWFDDEMHCTGVSIDSSAPDSVKEDAQDELYQPEYERYGHRRHRCGYAVGSQENENPGYRTEYSPCSAGLAPEGLDI